MSIHRKGGLPAMCSSGPRGWVRLRLKGGTWLGGAFATRADGTRSCAAGYPERQDLYLVESVEVDPETGSFLLDDEGTPVSRGSSILIRRPDQLPARRRRRTTRRRSSCWLPSPRRVRDCSGHLERLGPEGSDRDGIGHAFERIPASSSDQAACLPTSATRRYRNGYRSAPGDGRPRGQRESRSAREVLL